MALLSTGVLGNHQLATYSCVPHVIQRIANEYMHCFWMSDCH